MGGGILLVQARTLSQLLSYIYPDSKMESKISHRDIWIDEGLSNYFIEWLKKQSKSVIRHLNQVMKAIESRSLLPLTQLLKTTFPDYNWTFVYKSKKAQYALKACLQQLFNNEDNKDIVLLEEYRHPDISNLELDYFLPQYNIAFEYQVMTFIL